MPPSLTERPVILRVPRPPKLVDRDVQWDKSPVIQKKFVSNLLCYLDKCIMLGEIHLRIFIELAEEFALSTIYHKSWLIREAPDDWWLANVTHTQKKGRKIWRRTGQLVCHQCQARLQKNPDAISHGVQRTTRGSGPARWVYERQILLDQFDLPLRQGDQLSL